MRRRASRTFVEDDNNFLWLALTTRDTGIPASERLGINDGVLALSFDLAVTLRLLQFDNEKDAANKKFWMGMLGSDGGNDSYVDADTIIV